MPLRFKLMSAILALLLLMATDTNNRLFDNALDVFVGLGVFMVLAFVSIIPNAGRVDRVDRQLDGLSWADRIDIENVRSGDRTRSG